MQNIPVNNMARKLSNFRVHYATILNGPVVPVVESHYNVQPVIDIFASVQDRDLGGVASDINNTHQKNMLKLLPKASQC